MNYLSSNLKFLRKKNGLTQEGLATKIDLKRSLIGAYEEGRAEPKISTLQYISDLFRIPLEKLVNTDLEKVEKENIQSDFEGKNIRILSILVDDHDQELISLVPIKASAGYLSGYSDPEYIENLPRFRLPVPELSSRRTYRAFQIKGDSMDPIKPGTYILSEYVQDWRIIIDGLTYILITKDDGIVYKRITKKLSDRAEFLLNSDNPEYPSQSIHVDNVLEVWKALGYISFELPDLEKNNLTLKQLSIELIKLREEFSNRNIHK